MLIYIILMAALAGFFYQESKKVAEGRSDLLREFCKDSLSQRIVFRMLRIICLTSAVSAVLMLFPFLIAQITGKLLAPLAALSILCYTVGFIIAMLQLKKLQ